MRVAITGADGYVGRTLLRRILETGDDQIVALVRARDRHELDLKRARLELLAEPHAGRLQCRALNLPEASGLNDLPVADVRFIVHCAAVTEFNVSRAVAEAVNVEGTRALLRFARRCQRLERVVLVSTIFSSGLRAGRIDEVIADDRAGFANQYEWSKWAAEALLERDFSELPWQVHRLATVLCDDESGRVVQFNVVHKIWHLLHSGLLPLIPGTPQAPLYFVTGAFAAHASEQLLRRGGDRTVFQLCNAGAHAITAGRFLDAAYRTFLLDPDFARRRVLCPLFADEASFERLAASAVTFSRGTLGSVLGSMRPFAKQMFVSKWLNTDAATALAGQFQPDWDALVARTCKHLLESGFGLGRRS